MSDDLVMRALGLLCSYEVVSRAEPHDLLIRGSFSDGSLRARLVNKALRLQPRILSSPTPVTLHISSENPFSENYQSYDQSGCSFGLGFEIRNGDTRYFRMPHWWNYIDFRDQGVPSPESWVRLGQPLLQKELLNPLRWNRLGKERCILVATHLHGQRKFLMDQVSKVLPVDGFGRAFDSSIAGATKSGQTKRQLLRDYQFCFCPENSISPGYYTEKIPESYACGSIPIAYVDTHASIDFNPDAFLNIYDYLDEGISVGLSRDLNSSARIDKLMATPLLRRRIELDAFIDFIRNIVGWAKQ